jgi:hypothetical protein
MIDFMTLAALDCSTTLAALACSTTLAALAWP